MVNDNTEKRLARVEWSRVNWKPGANEKEEKGKKSKPRLPWIGSEHNGKSVPECIENHLSTRLAKQTPCWCQGYSATRRSLSSSHRVCVGVRIRERRERERVCVHAFFLIWGFMCEQMLQDVCICMCACVLPLVCDLK